MRQRQSAKIQKEEFNSTYIFILINKIVFNNLKNLNSQHTFLQENPKELAKETLRTIEMDLPVFRDATCISLHSISIYWRKTRGK